MNKNISKSNILMYKQCFQTTIQTSVTEVALVEDTRVQLGNYIIL